MAVSWPFDSTVTQDSSGNPLYSRSYSSDVIATILAKYFCNGVFASPTTCLQVVQADDMTVTVKAGAANINGRQFYEETDRVLTVQAASATLDRIDTVVLRLNLAQTALTIDLYIVQGTAAATPTAPELTRNATVWELGLANLFISKGCTTVTQERITDTRLDTERCGIVVPTIGTFNTTALYTQIQSDLASFKANQEASFTSWSEEQQDAFDTWFSALETELSGDVAAMLTNRVTALEGKAIGVYTHTRSTAGVHNFAGSGANGRALITAAFQSGDTFTVNGTAVSAYTGADATDELPNGRWVTFVYDGTQLNFKGGGAGGQLKAIAVASEAALPTAGKNGMVALVTSTAIGNVYVQKDEPTCASAGDVWILTASWSSASIELAKAGSIKLYPMAVKQYISDAWTTLTSYAWQDSAWKLITDFVYSYGIAGQTDLPMYVTGGVSLVTYDSARISIAFPSSATTLVICSTRAIDLTNVTSIVFSGIGAKFTSGYNAKLFVSQVQGYTSVVKNIELSSEQISATLDTTSLTGEYYIGMRVYTATSCAMRINEIKLVC